MSATSPHEYMDAETWNREVGVGTPVRYHPVFPPGTVPHVDTTTRSEAWEVGDHTLVQIAGRTGGVSTRHLEVLTAAGTDVSSKK